VKSSVSWIHVSHLKCKHFTSLSPRSFRVWQQRQSNLVQRQNYFGQLPHAVLAEHCNGLHVIKVKRHSWIRECYLTCIVKCISTRVTAQFFLNIQGVLKRAFQRYCKRYCMASVTKTFALKGLQTINRSSSWTTDSLYAYECNRFRNTRHTVTFGIPL
jgi:hypothetical protein